MGSQADADLIRILKNLSLNADARLQGWEYILALTAAEKGLLQILQFEKYLPFILSYIELRDAEKESLLLAHKCLINISSTERGASALVERDFAHRLLKSICEVEYDFVEQSCYILSNLSTHCCNLMQGLALELPRLLEKLLEGFCHEKRNFRDKYKFLALFFGNITRQPEARRLILEADTFISKFVLCMNAEESEMRRLGVALTLRNCCFETGSHKRLLHELNFLPVLLLPLMGPEEYEDEEMEKLPIECQYLESSKERERIPQIRRSLVQALCLLCYTEEGWNLVKSKGVYSVARELHKWERDPSVIEAIETLVEYTLVEKYAEANSKNGHTAVISHVIPAETDILKDVPDFII